MTTVLHGTRPGVSNGLGRVKDYERVRMDSGVVQYRMLVNDHLFVVDLRRLVVDACTCHIWNCQHSKAAVNLESAYQARHADAPDSCISCGRMCRSVRGLALCSVCVY